MSIYQKLSMSQTEYFLNHHNEIVETALYSAICFLVPFLLGHSQILTGIIVNAALVLAALNIKDQKLLPIITLPSIAVLSRGIIFGPFTMYIVYMIPFIWVGNLLIVVLVKKLFLDSARNRWLSLALSSTAKAAFIFAGAFALFSLAVIPKAFLIPMGPIQLLTAILGGTLAFGVQRLKRLSSLG